MKRIRKLLFIVLMVIVCTVPAWTAHASEDGTQIAEKISPTPVPIRQLVTKGNKIYYYYKGKMVKNAWKRYNGYKYYFGSKGNAVRGCQRINNVVYIFDEKGRLFENKQNRIVSSCGNSYHIRTKYGRPTIGYFIYNLNP